MRGAATYSPASFQQALLQAISAHTPECIAVVTQKDLRIIYINEPGARLFGYKHPSSFINKTISSLKVSPLSPNELRKIKQTIQKKAVFIDEVKYKDEKGVTFWGRLQVNGFVAGDEKCYLVQIKKIDRAKFTEENQVKETEAAEIELKQLLKREKELSLLKTRFISTASHEFRTPLSTILSSAYLLQKYVTTEDQPKRDKHIERIASSVNMLIDILNDFLSVSKIEEGKIDPKFVVFNFADNINDVIAEIRPVLKKGQEIIFTCRGKKEVWLDPSMLRHIVMNLLSNAIKFSPVNAIIKVEAAKKNNLLTLTITDNGIGISKQDQQHLFERFFRGANAANIQGTGLGLHIVKKYAELMSGNIQCESELENGTSFKLSFRLSTHNNTALTGKH